MSATPPNIRELAASLNLSTATISRALSHSAGVSVATRERVLAAAAKAGYHPNALVNALMSQVRTKKRLKPTGEVVAYLTSHLTEDDWRRHPSHVQQFEGARQRAEEFGFQLQPFWLGINGINSRQIARIFKARGVRGSLLAPVFDVDHHPLELDWQHHAVVAIGHSFQQVALHRAVHDNINVMTACHSQLSKLGHQRIGLVLLQSDNTRVRRLWVTGYLGVQWQEPGARLDSLLLENTGDEVSFSRWLKVIRPDAIIGIWQDFALQWMQARGLRVPEDISYATLDLGDRVGKIAGMLQDNHGLGAAAMDMLAGQLFRNEIGVPATPKIIMVEGTWMDGPTVARRPDRPAPKSIPGIQTRRLTRR